ncbi:MULTISPECIES: hypothetical protein [Nostocales]|uniref:Uncharacterized protein n=3 Tax=Nostocales TaxID=1161 RepID=A0A0C1N3F4_9CYAN|nr:hypothetical protein [Tolypothrix bouteillei]KAF3889641.1 hypothetical protein DA73_0400032345 [Tolypothrix bouteillei VB521301]
MDFDVILNELSLQNPAPNEAIARQWMSNFISTIKAIKDRGIKVSLRTKDDFHTTLLAPNYPLRRWLNDKEVDQIERGFIKTLATKSPFSTDLINSAILNIENNIGLSEFCYQGEQVIGLGVAHILDTISVSLLSDEKWNCRYVNLEFRRIDEDGELIDEVVKIVHASCKEHIQKHSEWFKYRIRTTVLDGLDIWNLREDLFPNLVFCDDVYKQVQSLNSGNPILRQVIKRLFEMEETCKNWTDGVFDMDSLPCKVSPESDSRLKRLKKELTFKCPDGNERVFSLHVRMTPGAWRLHFSVDLGPGKIIIGYIGLKIM